MKKACCLVDNNTVQLEPNYCLKSKHEKSNYDYQQILFFMSKYGTFVILARYVDSMFMIYFFECEKGTPVGAF